MFDSLRNLVFSGCMTEWDYMLSMLLLLLFFDLISSLIEIFGKGAR